MKKNIVFLMVVFAGMMSWSHLASAEEVMSPKDVASTLGQLADRAIDGNKGFQEAAENAASADLKARFAKESAVRAEFAAELKGKIKDLGQEADQDGSAEASAHRAWIDAKTALTKQDDNAVLGAVKTGEAEALDEYNEALDKNLPTDVRSLVEKQIKDIQESYDWTAQRLEENKNKNATN
jgi:uncharacterized protein (TIGR02284 family)